MGQQVNTLFTRTACYVYVKLYAFCILFFSRLLILRLWLEILDENFDMQNILAFKNQCASSAILNWKPGGIFVV